MLGYEKWKSFRLAEIFDIKKGKRLTRSDMENGDLNFIGAISKNNGIREKIKEDPQHPANVITVNYNGSVAEAFYQDEPFWASDDVNVLYLRERELNRDIALFLCTIIKLYKSKFNYGRKWNLDKMKESEILLPVDDFGMPNWDFMQDYVKMLSSSIKFSSIISNNSSSHELHIETWDEYRLFDYFEMYAGEYVPATDYANGETYYISASNLNNGVMQTTNLDAIFAPNTITIGKVGMSTFYQPLEYAATSDVTVLQPRISLNGIFNKYIGMFIITVLKCQSYKWSFGRQIRLGDCQQLRVRLPKDANGQPDWDYMENYIKSLPYSDRI